MWILNCSKLENSSQVKGSLDRGSFARRNREHGKWCCEWLDDLQHRHLLCTNFFVFCALQETDNWTVTEMEVGSYIVYGRDHGKATMMCPRQVGQFRCAWVGQERCTAILVASLMILSIYLPHGG